MLPFWHLSIDISGKSEAVWAWRSSSQKQSPSCFGDFWHEATLDCHTEDLLLNFLGKLPIKFSGTFFSPRSSSFKREATGSSTKADFFLLLSPSGLNLVSEHSNWDSPILRHLAWHVSEFPAQPSSDWLKDQWGWSVHSTTSSIFQSTPDEQAAKREV